MKFSYYRSSRFIFAEFRATHPPSHIRIDRLIPISDTDILLMHLAEPTNITQATRPLGIPTSQPLNDLTHCMAMFDDSSVEVQLSFEDCEKGKVCGRRIERVEKGCRSASWTGVLVCEGDERWLPVGVFSEKAGLCGFQVFSFTSVLNHSIEIAALGKFKNALT